jgi:hypothetical protein
MVGCYPRSVGVSEIMRPGVAGWNCRIRVRGGDPEEGLSESVWTVFVVMVGLIQARVANPVTAQKVIGIITGTG